MNPLAGLLFEVAFDVDPADVPTAGDWTALPRRVDPQVRVSTGRGFGQGRASLTLDNRDRLLDPTNPDSPYNLVPMRHARLTLEYGGTTYPLFRGFAQRWMPQWPAPNMEMVTVELVSAGIWLAMLDAEVAFPRQLSHDRVDALLDLAAWPAGLRDLGDGVVWLESYEADSDNLARLLADTAEAEDGFLVIDPDGTVRFGSRHARFDAEVAAEFGADGIPYTSVDPQYDADGVVNIARTELADGAAYQVVEAGSVQAYGPRYETIRDLSLNGPEAKAIAGWSVYRFAEPTMSLGSLAIDGGVDGAMPTLLSLRVGDLVRFVRTSTVGDPFVMVGSVDELTHTLGPGRWQTKLTVSPYFGAGPWFTLNDDTLGELDSVSKLAP